MSRVHNRIFISYSHADKKWLDEFLKHLKPYARLGTFSIWSDTQIKMGQLWQEEITRELATAGVAILVVSPDFMASDFIADEELPQILNAAKEDGLLVYWVPIRASAYETTFLKEIQSRPSPGSPLASLTRPDRERVLVEICKAIAQVAQASQDKVVDEQKKANSATQSHPNENAEAPIVVSAPLEIVESPERIQPIPVDHPILNRESSDY